MDPTSSPVRSPNGQSPAPRPPAPTSSPFHSTPAVQQTSSPAVPTQSPSVRGAAGGADIGSSSPMAFSTPQTAQTPSRGAGRPTDQTTFATPGSRQRVRRPPGIERGDLRRSSLGGRTSTPTRPQDATGGNRSTEGETPSEVEQTFVWGTTVNVNDARQRFRRFIHNFEKEDADAADGKYYISMLQEILEKETMALNLDCQNLHSFDPGLYQQLVSYPQEIIPIFDIVINDEANYLLRQDGREELEERVQVRTYNLTERKHMRDLNPSDIDCMVSVSGMVTRCSGILPDLKAAFFRCLMCGHSPDLQYIDRGRIQEPPTCLRPQCAAKFSMQLEHNRCVFANRQQVKMQETPDEMPEGETPHTVNMCTFDDLVDVAKPGDRIEVTGVYRAVPMRTNPNRRTLKAVYKTYIDIIHIKKDDSSRMRNEAQSDGLPTDAKEYQESDHTRVYTEEQIAKFQELANSERVYDTLVESFAPSIWEMDDIKKGVLCLLFGGANQDGAGQGGKFRGEINVLLVGDPGVSKSQLLGYVHKIAPRGIYTSGRGSSAVGLTAYVTRDMETREMVMESGALVLSDKGVCCIDEFDKMSESARSTLHEVMEQQTVSVAKAGIICTLNARTSILASANPIGSRYNPHMSVVDNIQLPPTLLSRFDLIYLLLDKADQTRDRRLAHHLVSLHFQVAPEQSQGTLSRNDLTEYLSYARQTVQPKLSDEAATDLVEGYVEMRRLGGHKRVITATPRQLESLIRLSEALARMRLSSVVDKSDVKEALRLMKVALKQSATDHRTGLIDMDAINTGRTAHDRYMQRQLADGIKDLMQAGKRSLQMNALLQDLNAQTGMNTTLNELKMAVTALVDEGSVSLSNGQVTLRV